MAALLAGYGLKGIGKGLGGGIAGTLATGAAASAVTGKDVQPVYVVNAGEIGGAGGMLGGLSGAAGALGKVGAGGLAIAGGAAAGYGLSELASSQSKRYKEANPDSWFTKMDNKMNLMIAQFLGGRDFAGELKPANQQKVIVELNERQLKATKQPSRGASF